MTAELYNLEVEAMFLGVLARVGRINAGKARVALEQSLVTPDRLHSAAHREILAAMAGTLAAGHPVDARALWTRLKDSVPVHEMGGLKALDALLCAATGHQASLPEYAECIRGLALRRKLVEVGRELAGLASDKERPVADTLAEVTRELAAITLAKRELKTAEDYLLECVDEMEAVATGKAEAVIPTGLAQLDSLIGGLQPTLIAVGAMPGVGKSALFATLIRNLAASGRKVGLFSLEDEGRWLAWRVLSHESGVPQFVLRHRRLTESQQMRTQASFDALKGYVRNIVIDDRSALSPQEIVQTSRDMILNHGCQAIFVDHAGEIRYPAKHRDRYDLELMDGLSDLREIAKRYRVPVVVAAHLRRRQGLETGTEPTLTDFANSSAFERQSRVALGLSRESGSDSLRVTVLKQTNGATSFRSANGQETHSVDLKFVGIAAMVADVEGREVRDWYAETEAA